MDFVAKQMLSNKMGAVKGELGKLGGDEKEGEAKAEGGEDPEVLEAMREAEEKRKDKYRKMEEEREIMRQGIRDKYGLKKKEPEQPVQEPGMEGRLTRAKKTPEELAKEKEVDSDEDEFQSNPLTRWLSNCTPQ